MARFSTTANLPAGMGKVSYRGFVNPDSVLKAVGKSARRVLVRQGAYVRSVMRNALGRKAMGGKPALPGQSPRTHNRLLKNSILYGLTSNKESVLIGPTATMAGIIGRSHEFGMRERNNKIPGRRTASRTGFKDRKRRPKVRKYPKRPFSMPALKKAAPRLAEFYRDSIGPRG